MMGTEPRTARGRATRERILNAATELVAEQGVAATSLDDVCERAQASKSQLYLYFADREDLLRAVAAATSDVVIESQAEALAGFDSLSGIRRYLDGIVALQIDRGAHGGCPIGTLAAQLVEQDDGARLILADGMERWEAGLRRGLEQMAARGELKPDADPGLLANKTLQVLQGGLLLTQIRRDPAQSQIAAETVMELISGAVRTDPPSPGYSRTTASPTATTPGVTTLP
jgi:AcrR family transcriptional regulator